VFFAREITVWGKRLTGGPPGGRKQVLGHDQGRVAV